jgi:phage tail-like protein
MPVGQRNNPFPSYNFAVEIEGLVSASFSEVSGLGLEIEVNEYREGGQNEFIHKRAGSTKYPNLILKRGMNVITELWDWYWKVANGTIQRKNLSVVMMDASGQEWRRWNFEQAYPVKWVGPDLRGNSNEIAVESLEFAHKGLVDQGSVVETAAIDVEAQFSVSVNIDVSF